MPSYFSTLLYISVYPLSFDVSACAQKIGDFVMLNNIEVKNESACAQQKHWFAEKNQLNWNRAVYYSSITLKVL